MNFEQYNEFEVKLQFEPAPRPNKVHIGLVQLANDHTLETDWSHLLGEQAALFSTRIFKENGMTPEALDNVAARKGAVIYQPPILGVQQKRPLNTLTRKRWPFLLLIQQR